MSESLKGNYIKNLEEIGASNINDAKSDFPEAAFMTLVQRNKHRDPEASNAYCRDLHAKRSLSVDPNKLSKQQQKSTPKFQFASTPSKSSSNNKKQKTKHQENSFEDWTAKDFSIFLHVISHYGELNFKAVVIEVAKKTGKKEEAVKNYCETFWNRYHELSNYSKVISKAHEVEKKNSETDTAIAVVDHKMSQTVGTNPKHSRSSAETCKNLEIMYGAKKGPLYTEEEDAFLLYLLDRHGYGEWEKIKNDFYDMWQFKFDWWMRGRKVHDIEKRCSQLLNMIKNEPEYFKKMSSEFNFKFPAL